MSLSSPEVTQRPRSLSKPGSAGALLQLALGLGALLLAALPSSARADAPSLEKLLEVHMYGRMGVAWAPTGQVVQGKSLNLTGSSIGGRLEEGDYLEPTIKFHILPDSDTEPYAKIVLTPAMFAKSGSYLSLFTANNLVLDIEIFQAYAEAGNILVPGLKMWGGARFYRGTDVHIADTYYFNNLSGQGGGIMYGPLDLAVLIQTGTPSSAQYGYDSNADSIPDATRQRTVFVAQYVQPLAAKHTIQGLAELHVLPAARQLSQSEIKPGDLGFVLGAKLHLDLDNGNFNDISIRYGNGIANGGLGGSQTWSTFGAPNTATGLYSGAMGIEAVEHFVWNANRMFALNGYGILHYSQGASGLAADSGMDATVGARSFLYITNQFHLINELHIQGRKIGDGELGTMVKLSIVPTFVPTGERSVWARPHLRAFYTIAFYNDAAREQVMTPYMQATGARTIAHYVGARAEWWF